MKTIADDFSSNSQSGKDPLSLAWTNPWFVGKGIVVHHREKCFCFEFQEVNTYRVPHRLTIRFVSFPIQDHQTASLTLSLHFVIPWWPWRISSIISDCKALGWESLRHREIRSSRTEYRSRRSRGLVLDFVGQPSTVNFMASRITKSLSTVRLSSSSQVGKGRFQRVSATQFSVPFHRSH